MNQHHPTPRPIFKVGTKIVAAAVRMENGMVVSLPAPARHHHVMTRIVEMFGVPMGEIQGRKDSGFITDTGRYVTRKKARSIAEVANQILDENAKQDILFSEDVW